MPWRVVVSLIVLAIPAIAEPSSARELRQINPTPFAHSPCSVLDNQPCTPTVCSPLHHGPCIPEIDYPIGENLQVTIESKPADKDTQKYIRPDHDLNTIGDLFAMLRSCWTPPSADVARKGMQMSVQFSFKRDGTLIAPPRVTYATPDASARMRDVYRQAIDDALAHCAPLPLTRGLGGAIAGRPIMIRYVDNRPLDKPDPDKDTGHP
jgi:hypothetical protein